MAGYETGTATGREEEMRRKAAAEAEMIEKRGTEMSQRAAEKGAQVSRNVADMVRRAGEKGSEISTSTREMVDRDVNMMKSSIRAHPVVSVMVAAGMGMLLGAAIGMISGHAATRRMENRGRY